MTSTSIEGFYFHLMFQVQYRLTFQTAKRQRIERLLTDLSTDLSNHHLSSQG